MQCVCVCVCVNKRWYSWSAYFPNVGLRVSTSGDQFDYMNNLSHHQIPQILSGNISDFTFICLSSQNFLFCESSALIN